MYDKDPLRVTFYELESYLYDDKWEHQGGNIAIISYTICTYDFFSQFIFFLNLTTNYMLTQAKIKEVKVKKKIHLI